MPRPLTVVTGGTRGIGAATAARLAADGHDLVLSYASDTESAAKTAALAEAAGARCVTVAADVSAQADVDRLFDTAAQIGTVTGLVNNAGVTGGFGPLAAADPATIQRVIDVNVVGVLLCCRRAIADMTGGGAIVNVSSGAATLGSPGDYVHYAASKAAVDTLTLGLSKELGPAGIRVNAVAPGIIDTEIHASGGDPDRATRVGPQIPLGRAGTADEVANAIAWMLSPEASYTTGAVLRVAGGR